MKDLHSTLHLNIQCWRPISGHQNEDLHLSKSNLLNPMWWKILSLPTHGSICSCVGPIIDLQVFCKVFYLEKFVLNQISPVCNLIRDVFLPSLHDSLLVLRPSYNFRDGRVIQNLIQNFRQYLIELPFNDSYFFGLLHLMDCF